jgi:hypothetical protein
MQPRKLGNPDFGLPETAHPVGALRQSFYQHFMIGADKPAQPMLVCYIYL